MFSFLTFECVRTGRTRNALSPSGDRGFESLSLRHKLIQRRSMTSFLFS